jgi:hypothetical protein
MRWLIAQRWMYSPVMPQVPCHLPVSMPVGSSKDREETRSIAQLALLQPPYNHRTTTLQPPYNHLPPPYPLQTVAALYAVPSGPGRSRVFTGVASSDPPPFSWRTLLQPSVLSILLIG